MEAMLLDHAVEAIIVAFMGLLAFLVRSFFSRIHEDLKALKTSVDKLEGRFQMLQDHTRDTHTDLAVTRQELKAIWKFVDNAHQRATDLNGGEES